MDLIPTQDVDEIHDGFVELSQNPSLWGRLLPLDKKMLPISNKIFFLLLVDLVEDSYTFGRGEDCSYTFTSSMFDSINSFSTISKHHFKIFVVCLISKFYLLGIVR